MTEEERRRCIILGICGGGGGAAPMAAEGNGPRRAALRESLAENGHVFDLSDAEADYFLGLIDEARG